MRKQPSSHPPRFAFVPSTGGATAVEFALIAPIFLALVMGMAGYGVYFGASHSVQQIAADAARTAISGLTETERKSIVAAYVSANAGGYPFIDPMKVKVETRDNAADANQFVVTVTYDASDLPIYHLLDRLAAPGSTIRRQSTIRVGGL
ncbi:MAG: pilus assembly protein [Rhizobiaceae bacterium]|nr:pilus assembly protein [Rhizobiaceae bacterium]